MKGVKSMKISEDRRLAHSPLHGLPALHGENPPFYSTKLFNPSFNRFTLKLIRNPCRTPASFM